MTFFFFLLPLTARGWVVDTVYDYWIDREVFCCYDPSYGDTIYLYLTGIYHEDNPASIYNLTVCQPPPSSVDVWWDRTYYRRYEGDIVIPDTIMVDGVCYTIRGLYALNSDQKGIASLTISRSLTSLNWINDVYCDTYRLDSTCTRIVVDKDNPKYASYDGMLFSKDYKTVFYCPRGKKGDCTLPDQTKEIYTYAFRECYYLQSVTGNAVTDVGLLAFSCSPITSLSLPAVEYMGWSSFEYTHITSFFMPAAKGIYWYAFSSSYLTSVNVPDSTTYLDACVFYDCPFLACVQIGSNPDLDSIYMSAFADDPKLKVLVLRNPIPPMLIGGRSSAGTTPLDSVTLYVPCGCKERYSESEWGECFSNIKEQCEEDREILVYPNPAKNYVCLSGSQDIKAVTLCDLQGRVLQRQTFGTAVAVVDLSALSPGLYVASLLLQDGSRVGKEIVKR